MQSGGGAVAKFWPEEESLHGFGTDKGVGFQNPKNLANVICEPPLNSSVQPNIVVCPGWSACAAMLNTSTYRE